MKILNRAEIDAALRQVDLMEEIEAGFVAYSRGRAVVPPVGEMLLSDPQGEVHIKYGYITGDDYYVIKIASGFAGNVELGIPTSNGLMLAFSQQTGALEAVLLDEGSLTDIRTAVAGAVAAKYLAPPQVDRIGIIGTGIQARLQLEYLLPVTPCRRVLIWGRSPTRTAQLVADVAKLGCDIEAAVSAQEVLEECNLIVTTTPAHSPLLHVADEMAGKHITAMGSDTPDKQELDATILGAADVVVADSIAQCLLRGEIHQALRVDAIQKDDLVELGDVISGHAPGRTTPDQLTVADLTGVAVQDIQITKAVLQASGR